MVEGCTLGDHLFLKKNQTLLKFRIRYNRLLVAIGGVMGTMLIVSTFILRHIPTSISYVTLVADLAKQNTMFNIVTAVATFFAAIHSGHKHNEEGAKDAEKEGIPKEIIDRVYREAMMGNSAADWLGLQGRNVVISGGGGGIGRAMAARFASEGMHVVIADIDAGAEQVEDVVAYLATLKD